jgi:hypothetical protein
LAFFYVIPLILVFRSERKITGSILVVFLSWIGYLIHWVALKRAKRLSGNA